MVMAAEVALLLAVENSRTARLLIFLHSHRTVTVAVVMEEVEVHHEEVRSRESCCCFVVEALGKSFEVAVDQL